MTVQPRDRSFTGRDRPCRMGPIAMACVLCCTACNRTDCLRTQTDSYEELTTGMNEYLATRLCSKQTSGHEQVNNLMQAEFAF